MIIPQFVFVPIYWIINTSNKYEFIKYIIWNTGHNWPNLFLKVSRECLAFIGGKGEKFLWEDQIGQLEAPIEITRNFKQRTVEVLIHVLVDRCSKKK